MIPITKISCVGVGSSGTRQVYSSNMLQKVFICGNLFHVRSDKVAGTPRTARQPLRTTQQQLLFCGPHAVNRAKSSGRRCASCKNAVHAKEAIQRAHPGGIWVRPPWGIINSRKNHTKHPSYEKTNGLTLNLCRYTDHFSGLAQWTWVRTRVLLQR